MYQYEFESEEIKEEEERKEDVSLHVIQESEERHELDSWGLQSLKGNFYESEGPCESIPKLNLDLSPLPGQDVSPGGFSP